MRSSTRLRGRCSGTCHCRGRMRLSSLDWLRGRTSGKGERRAQRTLNPQTLCPDENGELGNQKMSSEDNEANGRADDEGDEDEELEEETEDESEEHVSEQIVEREEDSEHGKEKRPKRPKT